MTELSTEARAILDAGHAGLSPSAATKASVLSAVEGNIIGATSTSLGASATAGSGVASLKFVLALVLAVGVGGGIWLARTGGSSRSSETNTKSVSISTNAVPNEETPDRGLVSDKHGQSEGEIVPVVAPNEETTITEKSPSTESAESAELQPADEATKQRAVKKEHPPKSAPIRPAQAHRKTKPTVVRSTLADEQKLIAAAQVAIRKADYSEALGLLKNHKSQFPNGILAPERNAAGAIAGCLSEQRGSKAAGRRFLTNHAHSPLAGRVRSSCKLP